MFCSNCGKELSNQAVICPGCGCATGNFSAFSPGGGVPYSQDYTKIRAFAAEASNIKTLGVLAAICMFGIGIIFSIIIWVKAKKVEIPQVQTANPNELAELEAAKRKFVSGQALASLPLIGLGLCILIGSFAFAFSIM